MTTRYADNFVGVLDGTKIPASLADGRRVHAHKHAIVSKITLASQASGDIVYVGNFPRNSIPLSIELNTDTSLGSSTIAFGTLTSASKYAAAAVLTATDTPTKRMKADVPFQGPRTPTGEDVYMTIGAAALPSSGELVVVLEYAQIG